METGNLHRISVVASSLSKGGSSLSTPGQNVFESAPGTTISLRSWVSWGSNDTRRRGERGMVVALPAVKTYIFWGA
jgi:hypothetical protein